MAQVTRSMMMLNKQVNLPALQGATLILKNVNSNRVIRKMNYKQELYWNIIIRVVVAQQV